VGSEMCIRDRPDTGMQRFGAREARASIGYKPTFPADPRRGCRSRIRDAFWGTQAPICRGRQVKPAMISNSPIRIARARLLTTLLVLCAVVAIPRVARAHPMGNFSINHYMKIVAGARDVELDYIIDMAEIPTFQETKERGLITNAGDPALVPYLARQADSLKGGLTLDADGQPLKLECVSRQAIFPPGAGGLPTMKMGFVYRVSLPDAIAHVIAHAIGARPLSLHYRDDNFAGRAGWKEIIALGGRGAVLTGSSVPSRDRSLELTNYPTDMLHSPPQTLEAVVTFTAAPPGTVAGGEPAKDGARAAGWLAAGSSAPVPGFKLEANRPGTPHSAFTDLIKSKRMDLAFLLTACLLYTSPSPRDLSTSRMPSSA